MERSAFIPEIQIDHSVPSRKSVGPQLSRTSNEQLLEPMSPEAAGKLVRRLLAGYPNLGAHDPEGYVAVLTRAMTEFPLWAGERAVVKVDEENSQFPPSEKTLRKWLEDAVRPYKFAAEWEARTRQQLAERTGEPKRFMGTKGDGGTGTIYNHRNFDLALKRHGPPRGFFEKD